VLRPFDYPSSVVEAEAGVIFCLDPDLTITYCNPAWDRFAEENGGPGLRLPAPIGRCILDYIGGPDRDYFEKQYKRTLKQSEIWERDYECSSKTLYRKFRLRAVPMQKNRGLFVMNFLRVEHPHEVQPCLRLDDFYRDSRGLIRMCASCRRTCRNAPGGDVWDWVPDYVDSLPFQTTHGICGPCQELYYPGLL
jgi:PAS domain-containing protein